MPDEVDAAEWEFNEWSSAAPPAAGGGGLLQTILDEVTSIREGAAADRVALAKAISASFSKVDAELADVRGQLTSVRGDLDELRAAVASTHALDKQLEALREAIPGDELARVAAEVERLRILLIGD
ncbi:MAG TPA: hypothetical protein VFV00_12680 [Acidimicrobiales bacterium]|nr:hypothetical protein [Acidimicrobiales bacterium]